MAKEYRTIKFQTSTGEVETDIRLEDETVETEIIESEFRALSGKGWHDKLGEYKKWTYKFNEEVPKAVWDIFNQAYAEGDCTFYFEEDDGSFTEYNVYLKKPEGQEATVSEDENQKTYRDVRIRVIELC